MIFKKISIVFYRIVRCSLLCCFCYYIVREQQQHVKALTLFGTPKRVLLLMQLFWQLFTNVKGALVCLVKCARIGNCSSVSFNIKNGTCLMFENQTHQQVKVALAPYWITNTALASHTTGNFTHLYYSCSYNRNIDKSR